MKKQLLFSRLLALTIVSILNSHFLQAQSWQDLGNPSVGGEEVGRIFNIEGYQSGVYLCSDKGLFVSTDNGATFNNLTWTSGVTAGEQIICLFIDETDNTMYAGGETTIFKSTDGGSSWTGT
ncbi:MAG: hypothetical protein R3359_13135, partial [Marinirhabdus sp.]|nr:hypothetical protein [Marinirhabdus sp.]